MRTVLVHGCFDVLHIGHVRLLKYARSLGDELVVSLLSDQYVREAKGDGRPINPLSVRMEIISALHFVNRVVVVDGPGHEAVERMIEEVRPAVYVKGADTRGKFGEEALLKRMGIELVYFDMVAGYSSTSLVEAL